MICELYEEEEKRRELFFKILGEYIGYSKNPCINCGRCRVEKYSSGNQVCEKCGIDQKTKKPYENEYGCILEYNC